MLESKQGMESRGLHLFITGDKKTPNLEVFPSVTSSLTTSIPPESLAVSGQSSATGTLSPSLM